MNMTCKASCTANSHEARNGTMDTRLRCSLYGLRCSLYGLRCSLYGPCTIWSHMAACFPVAAAAVGCAGALHGEGFCGTVRFYQFCSSPPLSLVVCSRRSWLEILAAITEPGSFMVWPQAWKLHKKTSLKIHK